MPSEYALSTSNEEHPVAYTRADWSKHYTDGGSFGRLSDEEKRLLAEHAPAPEGGRALDACCGTGELAVFLASLGYTVDGADFADGALTRARTEHAAVEEVRWLNLDVEHDDLAALAEDGYDLITMRLSIAFIHDRARVLRGLAARLRNDGVLIVITPHADRTPAKRRRIALDEDELATLTDGFRHTERFDTHDFAVLVLHRPDGTFSIEEKLRPDPQAVFGAAGVTVTDTVTDTFGRVVPLGCWSQGTWEPPGGRVETGEAAQTAGVRKLAEETGLAAREEDTHVITTLHDD